MDLRYDIHSEVEMLMVFGSSNCFYCIASIGFISSSTSVSFGPSFDFLRQFQNFCIPSNGSSEDLQPAVDLDHRFPAALHKEVVYRGAPWKVEMWKWLSGCDSITKEVSTVEVIRNDFFTKTLILYVSPLALIAQDKKHV